MYGMQIGLPADRVQAIELVITAFAACAPERVNTSVKDTMVSAVIALYHLGCTDDEIREAVAASSPIGVSAMNPVLAEAARLWPGVS
ncbi:MAG: hypothetical protein WC054_00730 [Candidatus Nanopelagicales bacterium]